MGRSYKVSRRDFVKLVSGFFGSIMGAGIALPIIGYVLDPAVKASGGKDQWIELGPIENYEIGKPVAFNFSRTQVNGWERTSSVYGGFVVRKSESEFEVLSNICTHLGCRVAWNEGEKAYICPCHDAAFTVDGEVISGPPPKPLEHYEFKIEDGKLFIHFQEA
jgi:menaquinol-cytochrome c reductase iron-sulfur subunit